MSCTADKIALFVGCYTKGHEPLAYYTNHAEGAYVVALNNADGSLAITDGPVSAGVNPTYAAFNPKTSTAYFTNENLTNGCIKAFRVADGKLQAINEQAVAGNHPCYVSVRHDGAALLCANYVSGEVIVFKLESDGSLQPATTTTALPKLDKPGPVEVRQDGPHAHCYKQLGDTDFGLCCDLGADQLFSCSISDGSIVGKAAFPEGSGPRHLAISSDAQWIYASTELANTICAFPVDPTTGAVGPLAVVASILPDGYDGPATSASHIELSPCGRFAYVGNRVGVPSDGACANCAEGAISVISLTFDSADKPTLKLVEFVKIGGKVPRGFCVVPALSSCKEASGWLIVGAQESSFVKSFAINRSNGRLSSTGHQLAIPSPGVIAPGPPIA